MKVGIKIYPDRLYQAKDLFKVSDFVELMITPGLALPEKGNIDFTIHSPHERWGVNIADKRLEQRNWKIMNHVIKAADKLKSEIIIVHAGLLRNKSCSKEHSIKFIKKLDDSRIIIENLCVQTELTNTPEDMKHFMQEIGCGLCFDFSHAITVAHKLKLKSYKPYVKKFLKLKPRYFHICDGYYDGKDSHLDLGKGDWDISFFKECIGSKPVALEIDSRTVKKCKEQIEFLKNEA